MRATTHPVPTTRAALVLGATGLALTGALAGVAPGAHAEDPGAGTTTHEVGRVLECTGSWLRRPVIATVYENRGLLNEVVVQVGDGPREVSAAVTRERRFVRDGGVRARLDLDGRTARLSGTVARNAQRSTVHEEYDDAGEHVVVDGVHRGLDTDLALVWRGRGTSLDCTGFAYDLQVTRTPA